MRGQMVILVWLQRFFALVRNFSCYSSPRQLQSSEDINTISRSVCSPISSVVISVAETSVISWQH